MPILLNDLTAEELHERLAHRGVTPRQARQIHAAAVRRGRLPDAAECGIARNLLEAVETMHGHTPVDLVGEAGFAAGRVCQVPVLRPGRRAVRGGADTALAPARGPEIRGLRQLPGGLRWAAGFAPPAGWDFAAIWPPGKSSIR